MPAQATANSVIASANRLIDVRHSCLSSSRIAEISVPAWPMPIHQTKLTIAKPHITGRRMPQIPTPRKSKYVTATNRTFVIKKPRPKPTIHRRPVGRVRTIALILSVTEAKLCPGART